MEGIPNLILMLYGGRMIEGSSELVLIDDSILLGPISIEPSDCSFIS